MFQDLSKIKNVKSRSISPENFTGEKGKGGMAEEGANALYARELGIGWKISPCVHIKPGETFTLADIHGQGRIRHIWATDNSSRNRKLILRAYWDGAEKPSIEAPMCDFFASADYQSYSELSSAAVCIGPKRGFNCYWDMPFYKEAKFTVENIYNETIVLYYQIDYTLEDLEPGMGYFHAQFRRVNPLPYKSVYTILDNIEGKGHYVGTYMFWGVNNTGWWGEGEIKFYMDGDTEFPTICGTGTEDYFCGSWNFDIGGKYQEFTNMYCGVPKIIRPNGLYTSQQRFSMYRWHLCDPIYFDSDLKVTIQALGWRDQSRYLPLQDDISSVAFWYQDKPCETFPEFPDADMLEII
ncbi:MAG: DUF2961 domain-containing protein [Clostridia bacterium]|nr:DUF2961 domain-containing protein [Oscillospiraceae bacterium]MBR6693558.1 DUF2961 domain-containing protein [Clostridia bacterium]